MCGLVGLIAKTGAGLSHAHADMFEHLLIVDQVRGMDGTGAYGVMNNKQVSTFKVGTNASNAIMQPEFDRFKEKIQRSFSCVVGHNRKATIGGASSKNSHPFDEGDIILVHNGTLHNHKELDSTSDVDSQAFARALNRMEPVEALHKTYGAYAFIWYDMRNETLNIVRNSERTLFIAENEQAYVFASEPWMITSAANRHDFHIQGLTPVRENQLITFRKGEKPVIKPVPERPTYGMVVTRPSPKWDARRAAWEDEVDCRTDCVSQDGIDSQFEYELERAERMADLQHAEEEAAAEILARRANGVPSPQGCSEDLWKVLSSDLNPGTEVALIVERIELNQAPPKSGQARGKRAWVKGYIPYMDGKIDVTGWMDHIDDLDAAHQSTWDDDKGNPWLFGYVICSGWAANGGAWVTVNGLYHPNVVHTHNKINIPGTVWEYICSHHSCDTCSQCFSEKDVEFSSVSLSKAGEITKLRCGDCIADSLPQNLKDKFNESRGKPVQDGQQVSASAG